MQAGVTIIRASFAPRSGPDGVPLERRDRPSPSVSLSCGNFEALTRTAPGCRDGAGRSVRRRCVGGPGQTPPLKDA